MDRWMDGPYIRVLSAEMGWRRRYCSQPAQHKSKDSSASSSILIELFWYIFMQCGAIYD